MAWPRESFAKFGIGYELSSQPKSGLYLAFLPLLNSGRIELPDNPRLVSQLCSLERRTARGGRDSIDHPTGQHDDLANAIAGVATIAVGAIGCSLELLMRVNDTYDAELAAEKELQRLAASGQPRPLWGPLAPGAVSLGYGGYRAPTYEEQRQIALAEQQRIQVIGRTSHHDVNGLPLAHGRRRRGLRLEPCRRSAEHRLLRSHRAVR